MNRALRIVRSVAPGFVVLATLCVTPRSASASPPFPDTLQSYLGLSYTPDCSLCHVGSEQNVTTAHQPLALALLAHGVKPEDTSSLKAAIDAMRADGTDSDHDGVGDVQELIDGTNPNIANTAGASSTEANLVPRYGCGASIAGFGERRGKTASGVWLFAAGVLALPLARRRRRK